MSVRTAEFVSGGGMGSSDGPETPTAFDVGADPRLSSRAEAGEASMQQPNRPYDAANKAAADALARLLERPGVKLPRRKNVPIYYADKKNPHLTIRELNGVTERGFLENGVFKVVVDV